MTQLIRSIALAAAIAALGMTATQAEAARVFVGVGVGVPLGGYYGPGYYGPGYYGPGYWGPYYEPRYVYSPPPAVVVQGPAQALPTRPDPIFYPKNGQPTAQIESDRQDCNRWAATQNDALSDAGVFQRATYACMEGRGYIVK